MSPAGWLTAWLVGQAATLIDQSTTPTLSAPWFTGQYQTTAGIAAVFALPLLLLPILEGVLRRDWRIISRAADVQLSATFVVAAGAVGDRPDAGGGDGSDVRTGNGAASGDTKTFFA